MKNLSRGKEHFDFLQWFRAFYDANANSDTDYDASASRIAAGGPDVLGDEDTDKKKKKTKGLSKSNGMLNSMSQDNLSTSQTNEMAYSIADDMRDRQSRESVGEPWSEYSSQSSNPKMSQRTPRGTDTRRSTEQLNGKHKPYRPADKGKQLSSEINYMI